MNQCCPSCGLRFSREEGYFTGAMYIGYALAVAGIAAIAGVLRLSVASAWTLTMVLGIASLLFTPLVPAAFRFARVLWIHVDRALEP